MKIEATRQPARSKKPNRRVDKKYFEFPLDPATKQEVEALARKIGCTPFQMSVTLLQDALSRISDK
jgi:hypothetical protein